MQIDQAKIEKAIVDEAVQGFITNEDLYDRVKKGIDARIEQVFVDRVHDHITAAVEAATKEGFDREYRKVGGFGQAVGAPTTISKELEKLVSGYWTQKVDRAGKPSTDSYNNTTRAEWMMLQICADDFSKEMKSHVVNVAGALKDHFRSVLNAHVGSLLSDVFKVQSQGDRDAKLRDSSIIHPPAAPIGTKAGA